MTVYSAVYMYEGIINDMKVFTSLEAARKYFHKVIDAEGAVEDCDPDYYNDGEGGNFYWWNQDDVEITIWKVEMEG